MGANYTEWRIGNCSVFNRPPYSPNHPANRSCKIGSVIHD
jgi:hypothetical protein